MWDRITYKNYCTACDRFLSIVINLPLLELMSESVSVNVSFASLSKSRVDALALKIHTEYTCIISQMQHLILFNY